MAMKSSFGMPKDLNSSVVPDRSPGVMDVHCAPPGNGGANCPTEPVKEGRVAPVFRARMNGAPPVEAPADCVCRKGDMRFIVPSNVLPGVDGMAGLSEGPPKAYNIFGSGLAGTELKGTEPPAVLPTPTRDFDTD